jgi:hypothetical protein
MLEAFKILLASNGWYFFGCLLAFVGTLNLIGFLWSRIWAYLTIHKHGYPPEHCDAVGNKHEEEEKDKEGKRVTNN